MIKVKAKGNFNKSFKFFNKLLEIMKLSDLDKYGRQGVEALKAATPKDTGKTSESWSYEIVHEKGKSTIYWTNNNINDGVNIAIIIQYGHATESGTYVQGVDYINPAIKNTFDTLAKDIWEEVCII